MNEAHLKTLHGGNQLCMQYLRDQYWITGLRSAMRKITRECVQCRIQAPKMSSQLMADLPAPRVKVSRPFTHCGVDFAGPLKLKPYKNSRGTKIEISAYASDFICFASKAVHLKLVGDLSSQAFLAALDRMVLRRNNLEHMYRDQGRNFIGAANELQRVYKMWQSREIANEIAARGLTWHFNTPMAPHHGGLWEAAVKSLKYHLHRAAGEKLFTFEELSTLLVRIEACLNSRPLVAPSDDPMDLTVITPSHLLMGQQIVRPLSVAGADIPKSDKLSWTHIRRIEQDIWERWCSEYLLELQRRTKWTKVEPNVQVGNLVIIKDDLMPPGHWRKGRVVEVFPGKDGLVRSVRVRTANSYYERPITKICVLPIDTSLADCLEVQDIQGE